MKSKLLLSAIPLALCTLGGCVFEGSHASKLQDICEIATPAPLGAISPRITAMQDGAPLLSWLEPTDDKLARLRSSFWQTSEWSAPVTIAEGQPFSRHPSESPGVVSLSKKNLIAYWSQKPPSQVPGKEVDVYFSISTNGGMSWSTPQIANEPGTGEESSYPSAARLDDGRAALIWLDGADLKEKHVRLISRTVQSDGSTTKASLIDPDTCTCCPTSSAQTDVGSVAAYRGHTPENIRDIAIAQNIGGHWSRPNIPHADRWHFAGCPVNGPHLDAIGPRVALIWFSGSEDQPKVRLAFSGNGALSFAPALRIDEGNAVGRAQVVLLPGHSALAFWIENRSGKARLAGRLIRNEETLDPVFEVAHGAGLGYPHAVRSGQSVFVTWAEERPLSRVHVAVLDSIGRLSN